jgi:hypothetical protein
MTVRASLATQRHRCEDIKIQPWQMHLPIPKHNAKKLYAFSVHCTMGGATSQQIERKDAVNSDVEIG